MKNPLVSICVVTYNQELVIRKCLESIVSQNTDFEFEVIVYDDASTDFTPNIIEEFSSKYSCVRAVLRKKNVGAYQNFIDCHSAARSNLICHCDGDDYWLQGKLKKQFDYMDNHHDCNILWHKVKLLESDGTLRDDNLCEDILAKHFTRYDLAALGTVGVHSSKMYRRRKNPTELGGIPFIDYALNIVDVCDGYAKILDGEALGVYRLGIGISSSGLKTKLLYTQCYDEMVKIDKKLEKYFVANALVKLVGAIKNVRIREVGLFLPKVFNINIFYASVYVFNNRKVIKMASLR